MLISALHSTGGEHVTVALDDGSDVPSTVGTIAELRLFVGKELEEADLQILQEASALALCRERAVSLLSYRPMSSRELRDKLVQKGEAPDIAEGAVSWMLDRRLLDDSAYAGMVVRHYAGKGYGAGRIRAELSRRGVSRDLWEEALAQAPEPDDNIDRFLASRLKDPSDKAQIQKVTAALYRRGFGWDEIRDALSRFCDEL